MNAIDYTSELTFWHSYIDQIGKPWDSYADEHRERLNPASPFQYAHFLEPYFPVGSRIGVLDVGAGPLSFVGKTWAGREIQLVPIDVLANAYNDMLAACGLVAPVPTIACSGEELVSVINETFEVVHCRNAMDHCVSPALVFENMWRILKPGGFLFLQHAINEGAHAGYSGLHQWNICKSNGDLTLWDKDRSYTNLSSVMRDAESVSIDEDFDGPQPWLFVVARKRP